MKLPISLGLLWIQEIRNWSDHFACVENNILHNMMKYRLSMLLFSYQVIPDSLHPHGLQHTRFPCPPQSPKVASNSRPLSQWCFPTISSSCLQSFLASGFFSSESALHIRLPKYWSFSISPSNPFRVDFL